ncbi:TPA: hypothetical protein ACX6R9_002142 [Photobacterium damselae]
MQYIEFVSQAIFPFILLVIVCIPMLIDSVKTNWRKRFQQQLRKGIINKKLSYNDLQHLAERWSQDRKRILFSLRIILSDAMSGEDENLKDEVDEIKSLLNEHKNKEPFAELPENISLQLSQLEKYLPNNKDSILQLAASLSELYETNQYDLSKQKKLTIWGFVLGVLGLLVGVIGLYSTLNPSA